MGRFWEVHLERVSQLDNYWKVVRAESREGAPLRIEGYVEMTIVRSGEVGSLREGTRVGGRSW